MSGMFLSRRKIVVPGASHWVTDPHPAWGGRFGTANVFSSLLPLPEQVTTSFRTSDRSGTSIDTDEALLNASSHTDFVRSVGRDSRESTELSSGYDTGHPFKTSRQMFRHSLPVQNISRLDGMKSFSGMLLVPPGLHVTGTPGGTYYPVVEPFNSTYYQVKAISNTQPTRSVASLSTALTELYREGVPSMVGLNAARDKVHTVRHKAGSEHLNVEFGWKPLISDTRKAMSAVSKSAKIWSQYQRDSGRVVRRSYYFPEERTVIQSTPREGTYLYDGYGYQAGSYPLFGTGFVLRTQTVRTRRIWFKGGYTYYLPPADSNSKLAKAQEYARRADKVLGVGITPEVVWNVAPWSWLSDWMVNAGDNIANATAFATDGLVMKWGYLMIETIIEYTQEVSGGAAVGRPTLPPFTISWVTHEKERVKASPFGFARNPNSFTNRQWGILAALGMTRGDRQLR